MTDPTTSFDNDTLLINDNDLRGEYSRMSRSLKEWLDVQAQATDEKRVAKLMLARTKKAVEMTIRERFPKPSDKAAEAEVEVHPMVIDCVDALQQAEYIEDRVQAIVESLKCKRSMLMCLGGLARAEIESDRFTT